MSDEEKSGQSMAEQVQARIDAEARQVKKKDEPEDKISSKFVRECLYANELGDGMLYAAIHKDKFLYNKSAAGWLKWSDHHWADDIMSKSQAVVEDVALRYLEEAKIIVDDINEAAKNGDKGKVADLQKTQGQLYKRVFRLRKGAGRNGCIEFAHTNPINALEIKNSRIRVFYNFIRTNTITIAIIIIHNYLEIHCL